MLEPGLPSDPIAVFLDRDGTLNVKAEEGEYIRYPTQLFLLPSAAGAVASLNRASLQVIVITNQRWLSDSDADPAAYAAVHARLERLLADEGAYLDAAYCCPHAPGECHCRKPSPGLLLQASEELGLDLSRCIMIGDRRSDVAAGRAAGAATVLLGTTIGAGPEADAVVGDLNAAVSLVLGSLRK